MKREDKLNQLNLYETAEKKDIRKAEVLDKTELIQFFINQGYTVHVLDQQWRHAHGKLEKDGRIFFLKMASTPDIGERTRNEASWNTEINQKINSSKVDYFAVPEIYETGKYEGKFYYLASYHEGPFLAEKDKTAELEPWLNKIVQTNLFLLSLKDKTFYRDQGLTPKIQDWDNWQNFDKWYEQVKDYNLEPIYQAAKNLEKIYEPGVNHGDFVPWHMIKSKNKFILIDAEHASGLTPRYLDIIYLYHRLYTKANNPELAKNYLNKIRFRLPKEERNKFEQAIQPILAKRIVGGYLDYKSGDKTDLGYHEKLKQDFLNNNLY